MDIRKVKKLIEMLESSNLNEIEIKEGEESVKLVKSGSIATQTMVPQIPVEKSMETSSENRQKDDVKNDPPEPFWKQFCNLAPEMLKMSLQTPPRSNFAT